jgi:DNA-binding transcriptional regulator GbsR (MarR family)
MSLKELVGLGLVYRETAEDTRRFQYRAETDLLTIATRIYREQERKKLEAVLNQIKKAERLLAQTAPRGAKSDESAYKLDQVRRLANLGDFVIGLFDAVMERTSVELKATQKWLSVSGKLGGEPLSRIRRAINASRMERKRRP